MRVFIVGGTGLLGSAGAAELIRRGHSVRSIALPPIPKGANLPGEMELILGNINEMSDGEIKRLIEGCEGFVFAAGVDERVEFPPPVYDAYYKYNIAPVKRLLGLAKECGVRKAVVLGSYFAYFAKLWPEKKLYEKHPYIRSRVDQENVALSFSDDKMDVMVLELPYIFGKQPGRKPVWMIFVKQLLNMRRAVFWPKGGTSMVTLRQVGECIAGAVERGRGGVCYPVGYYNMTWKEFLRIVNKYMGCPNKMIITIPTFLYRRFMKRVKEEYMRRGVEPGLDPVEFADVMASYTYIDGRLIREELGVGEDDIDRTIGESITYCLEILEKKEEVLDMVAK
ncbi:MAG: NAD(P)-dependent oxidoreductase [Thermoproteota archaeon]|nr:NAD(P)-dependent oxidoreductase [Candidatus Brockarchaeota archaeon]